MNSITDIDNLKFYTGAGSEIYTERQYVITWELVPSSSIQSRIKTVPTGFLIGDIEISSDNVVTLTSITAGVTESGRIIISENQTPDAAFREVFFNAGNSIKVSININNDSFSNTYKVSDVFNVFMVVGDNISTFTSYYGDNVNGDSEYYTEVGAKTLPMNPGFLAELTTAIPTIGLYFPFIRYSGAIIQEKVSTGFIAADTIIVLEKESDSYHRPSIAGATDYNYSLVFQPTDDSELFIIKVNESDEIERPENISFSMIDNEDSVKPFTFVIGTQSPEEGVFQNFLGIYLRDNASQNVFFMGALTVKTEIEGEDERFRTLLENFGVPDPDIYSNIFAEQDYAEEGKDYRLINRKSKELFLTYSDIFSYVGTYKALFKAIKFLGYDDIIFKEWYTILDSNDCEKDITVQVIDTQQQQFLKQKLATYGVSIEDFRRYNKINRLTMIYHLNQMEEDMQETIDVSIYDASADTWKSGVLYTDVCRTEPIYIYRNTEMLAKLYAVKNWLEKYIIGVNAYISDITGEGVYINWMKTQGYTTSSEIRDFSSEQHYTPNGLQITPFKNSSANVECTFNEINGRVEIKDYENVLIQDFIKTTYDISINTTEDVTADIDAIIVSNTFKTPVQGDEYQFELQIKPSTGTLYEWTDTGISQQILYNNGELDLMYNAPNDSLNSAVINEHAPYIILENANIHHLQGEWRNNIKWTIRELFGNNKTTYRISYIEQDVYPFYDSKTDFILVPGENACLKYTTDNIHHLPLFLMTGYQLMCYNEIDSSIRELFKLYEPDPQAEENEYILEILKGEFIFDQTSNVRCKLIFSDDNLSEGLYISDATANEQYIQPIYTYISERMPFTVIDVSTLIETLSDPVDCSTEVQGMDTQIREADSLYYENLLTKMRSNGNPGNPAVVEMERWLQSDEYTNYVDTFCQDSETNLQKKILFNLYMSKLSDNTFINEGITTNVTRIGSYDIYSTAFDKYNNMYMSKANKPCIVTAGPIHTDIYIAGSNSNNAEDFYQYNKDGEKLSSEDIDALKNDTVAYDRPEFPHNYKMVNLQFNNDSVLFDNISYAIDTPKSGENAVFDNLRIRCTAAEEPDKLKIISLFNENDIQVGDCIRICFYSPVRLNSIVTQKYPVQTIESDTVELNGIIEHSELWDETTAYIINVTEYEIETADPYIVDSNAFSLIKTYTDVFNVNDCVKVRYRYNDNEIINEAAYRVIGKNIVQEIDAVKYQYVLNKPLNYQIIGNDSITCFLTRMHHTDVHYLTEITQDAVETRYNIGFNNALILQDMFTFNPEPLFLNDYLDGSYGCMVYDYDPASLKKTWFNVYEVLDRGKSQVYKYTDFPVTIDLGQSVLFGPDDYDNVFIPDNVRTRWKVSGRVFETGDNSQNTQHDVLLKTLFRSEGGWLSFTPDILNSHNIEMESTDRYGNQIITPGEGLIFVK